MKKTTLLDFPCDFSIKAIGEAVPDLSQTIFDIVSQYASDIQPDDITFRHSKNKNYISLTITIHATSQAQLDQIYRKLTAHDCIKYVL